MPPRTVTALATILACYVLAVAEDPPPAEAPEHVATTQAASSPSNAALVNPEEAAAPALFRLDYRGELATRPALTGDWGGVRNQLAEQGYSIQLDVEQLLQGNARGGADMNNAFRYSGSWNLRLKFDTGRMGLWPGGLLELHAESFFGQAINSKVGSNVNDDALWPLPGTNEVMLPQVQYTQFLSENLGLTFGKLDTLWGDRNEFAWIHGDNFLHTNFRWNPINAATVPYSPLGAGVFVMGDWGQWSLSILDTEGLPNRTGFDTVFEGGTTLATEARFNVKPFGLTGQQTLGFVWSDKAYTVFTQDPRVRLRVGRTPVRSLLRLNRSLDSESGSWAATYNFDQYLYTEPEDPTQGIGVFGRVGVSDGDANLIQSFYSVGLGGKGVIPTRDNDKFGLGYFYTNWSNTPLTDAFGVNNAQGIELFYNIQVTPWLQISPDLQVLIDPGGVSDRDTAIVYGLWAKMSF
jgi:porin